MRVSIKVSRKTTTNRIPRNLSSLWGVPPTKFTTSKGRKLVTENKELSGILHYIELTVNY